MSKPASIALVGNALDLCEVLARALLERGFEPENVRVLAEPGRSGEIVDVEGVRLRVEVADSLSLAGADAVVFYGDGGLADDLLHLVPDGAICLDATATAMERTTSIPIVPEVNAEIIGPVAARGPLVLPRPASVGLAVVLAALHEEARVRRVIATVLHPASSGGGEGVQCLARQTLGLLQGKGHGDGDETERVAFNLSPNDGRDSSWSMDETGLAREVETMFGEPRIEVLATAVRAPVFYGIGQVLYIETEQPLSAQEALRLLRQGRGLLLSEVDPESNPEADPEELLAGAEGPVDVVGSDAVHIGHVRVDPARENGLVLWACFDDQRKGFALNVVATLEVALRDADR